MSTSYDYGFTAAFLKANPVVKKLVDQAIAGNWTASRFQVALQDTSWWKQTADTARAAFTEKTTDPATWARKLGEESERAAEVAARLGVKLSAADAKALATSSLTMGWDEGELREQVAAKLNWKTAGAGEAEATVAELQQLASDMGVRVTESWAQSQTSNLLTGKADAAAVQQQIRDWSAATYTQWATEIKAGASVKDLAAPWLQAMQQVLEVPPADVDLLNDPTLRRALVPAAGREVASLADFEQSLRRDPRWQQTKNARETLGGLSFQVLQDFGLVS